MAIQVGEGVTLALQSLRANKLRSFLTILGVIIGVTTIMAMISIIEGLNRSVKSQIAAIGSDVLYINPFRPGAFVGGFPDSLRRRPWFTVQDAEAIERECPSVRYAAPVNFTEAALRYGETEGRIVGVVGTSPSFPLVTNFTISNGRCFTEAELQHRSAVCILGQDHVEALFPHANPVGRTLHIGGKPFTVIGEVEPRGKLIGQSLDDLIVVPHTTLEKWFGPDLPMVIRAKPRAPEVIDAAIDEMTDVLRRQRHLRYRDPDNFAIFTDETLMDLYNQITGAFYAVMVIISSIGLMVGGIGVMNIMLVSVTERTREIGVRKALGARQRDVLWQFLVEAMTLTGAGGVVGIAIGLLLGWIVDLATPLAFAVPLWGVLLAFFSSAAIGLFFGIYPAVKAARLDPVETLRYE
jgi:putative ABC transport system permease protein